MSELIKHNRRRPKLRYYEYQPDSFLGLDKEQSVIIANRINALILRLAEAEFQVSCFERSQDISIDITKRLRTRPT